MTTENPEVRSQNAKGLDFSGVYRTRCGAIVRVLFWHEDLGCWVGKRLAAHSETTGLTWDQNGKHAYSRLDLMERVSGYRDMEIKFGLLRVK
jgi:hypothetical protein